MDVRFETKYGNKAGKLEWLTPPEIIEILGPFDLDVCYSEPRPWNTAKRHIGEDEDGLKTEWTGFCWCNPPYGSNTEKWLKKCSEYKNVIALVFARTETKMFHKHIWRTAKALYFFEGRLTFYHSTGVKANMSAGAPSCLVAWNDEGVERLKRFKKGALIYLNS
jgi:hypothetical protein